MAKKKGPKYVEIDEERAGNEFCGIARPRFARRDGQTYITKWVVPAEALPAKVGRPPLPPEQRVDERITVRLTAHESALLKRYAERDGVKPATWAAYVVSRKLGQEERRDEREERLREERRAKPERSKKK